MNSSACYTCTVDVTSSWFEKLCFELGAEMQISDATGGYKIVKCTPNPAIGAGKFCFLQLNENMSVFYADMEYHVPLRIKFDNPQGDYILLHFAPEECVEYINNKHTSSSQAQNGKVVNQISLMDCSAQTEYSINPGADGSGSQKSHALRILIKRKYAKELAASLFDKGTISSMTCPETEAIFIEFDMDVKSKIVMEKFSELEMSEPAYAFYLSAAAFSLITNFYENLGSVSSDLDNLHASDILAIQDSMETINSNLESQFPGIDTLARHANMSGSKYKRLFTQIYGDSPKKIFVDKKIDLGRELLLTGNYNVSDVVYQLGYSNKSFFSSLFKRRFGVSPGKIIDKR